MAFHGGFLWLDRKVSMEIELIAVITGLPLGVPNPTPFFAAKDKDIALTNNLKDKYDLTRDTRGFFIASINYHTVRFAAKVLDRKLG